MEHFRSNLDALITVYSHMQSSYQCTHVTLGQNIEQINMANSVNNFIINIISSGMPSCLILMFNVHVPVDDCEIMFCFSNKEYQLFHM